MAIPRTKSPQGRSVGVPSLFNVIAIKTEILFSLTFSHRPKQDFVPLVRFREESFKSVLPALLQFCYHKSVITEILNKKVH